VNAPPPLRLPASRNFPRKLVVHWDAKGLKVLAFAAAGAPFLAEAAAPHVNVRLRVPAGEGTGELFVGGASFNVSSLEAAALKSTFAPFGLRVSAE
jgi:hypothetical protein